MTYIGEQAAIKTDAPGIGAKHYKLPKGVHTLSLDSKSIYSIYLMSGELSISNNLIKKDSFTKVSAVDKITLAVTENSELFILQSPLKINYKKITDR